MFEGLARGGIPGGQLMITNDVENYPGFPEKIAGPGPDEATSASSRSTRASRSSPRTSTRSTSSQRPFRVWAGDDDTEHHARTLIIATGAQAKWLGLESETALQGKGVSACAVCDGAFFRNQDVIVVGGGDTAMEESMYLSGLCKTVTLVHRREEFRASKTMQDRVLEEPEDQDRLQLGRRRGPRRLEGRGHGRARQEPQDERDDRSSPATGFFVAIGHTPNTDLFKGQLELHDNGYIKTKPGTALHERARRLRVRRRAGLHVPPGRDGRGHGLHGRARRRAVAGGSRNALSRGPCSCHKRRPCGGRLRASWSPRPPKTSPRR